jgi:hypothetical protein
MTDERDPTSTLIIMWLQSIADGISFDKRPVDHIHEDLSAVARAARQIGSHEWADKIERAAKSVRDERPVAIIHRLGEELHADLLEERRRLRARGL